MNHHRKNEKLVTTETIFYLFVTVNDNISINELLHKKL